MNKDQVEMNIREMIRNEINIIKEDSINSFCQHNECAEQALHIYEKKDACYHKVKARYDVWPSAYASGALVKCRKVGAKNWGNKSKKELVVKEFLPPTMRAQKQTLKNPKTGKMVTVGSVMNQGTKTYPPALVKKARAIYSAALERERATKKKLYGKSKYSFSGKKEDVNENIGKLIGVAVGIAKNMSGNMTGAVKKIEKISKGLSKLKPVQKALRQYNEGFASDAQRRAAFASGYEEKGKKKKKKESVIKENPVVMAATHGAMNVLKKQQKKVPGKGGKPVAMTTALKDKTQPSHNKVKGIFKKLVDKLVKKKKSEPKQKQSKKDIDFYKKQFAGESYDIFSEDGGWGYTMEGILEAEYQGRKVKLGKPMQGDVKKFKVYVKNPKGNVVKVNFGQGGDAKGGTMRIRKSNPKARANFRARHNCDNPGPRHKARYWSCRKW